MPCCRWRACHHEGGDANAVLVLERKWEQQQRPAFGVIGDYDEGQKTLALSDLPLPNREEIEPLIRRGELLLIFETAPDLLAGRDRENIDARDTGASTMPVLPPFGFRSRQPWSLQTCL